MKRVVGLLGGWVALWVFGQGAGGLLGAAAGPPGAERDLVGWWRFEEGTGGVAKDSSSNHLDAVIHGPVEWIEGMAGKALRFDGNATVEAPYRAELALGGALTLEAWVRPADYAPNTYKHIVSLHDSYLLRFDNPPEGGKLSFFTFLEGNPEPRLQAGLPELNRWHLVIAVWNGQVMQLCIDGVKREAKRVGAPAPKAGPLLIGANFVGAIDEVKIYRRALTEDEILDQYPPRLETRLRVPRPVLAVTEPFELTAEVLNTGGQPLRNGAVELTLPPGVSLLEGQARAAVAAVSRQAPARLRWRLRADHAVAAVAELRTRFEDVRESRELAPLVIAKPLPQDPQRPSGPGVRVVNRDVILGNADVRVVFPWNEFGYGVYAVEAWQSNAWRRLAVAGAFSRLAVMAGDVSRHQMVTATNFQPLTLPAGQAGVAFRRRLTDAAGTMWDCNFSFAASNDDRVRITAEATPHADGSLALLTGPMLHAGEGSFGGNKDDALFGGVEWLEGEERSSASFDMRDPDYYVRFVPHPNKITVPLMAVEQAGAALGLLWDCQQVWDGTNRCPAAVFASPNFLEHQENHLLGLFLPAVPDWVAPNHLDAAATPYRFHGGVPLKLEAWLTCVTPAQQALACLPRWFRTFGVPAPAPLPRGDYVGEIEFSMRAYLESLWVSAAQKWWSSKGSGSDLLSTKGLPPHYALLLRVAAGLTADTRRQAQYLERAVLAERLGGFCPTWDDLGLTWGDPRAGLAAAGEAALRHLGSMGEDGAWRFHTRVETGGVFKGMDYAQLGPDQAAEVGTCARNVYEILRYARLSGDREVFRAAETSLGFMKQFRVPRAAQVWECPVHAPDILAAADAIEAYLEAYASDGARANLEEAIRWAWTGLPFVYVWNPPTQPVLRYASIAILGGSWHAGSWIGQPVQWNGLRYAYALLKLADHDTSFPWRQVAEGITVSALHQQDPTGPNVALWPDNFSALDWSKCPWVFEPSMILKNVLKLLGRDVEPTTTQVYAGDRRLWISSRAQVTEASWQAGALRFRAAFPAKESGSVVIAGVAKPGSVRINGRGVAETVGEVAASPAEVWAYDAARAWLGLKFTAGGSHEVQVEGALPRETTVYPVLRTTLDFNFDSDLEGWGQPSQITDLRAENGWLRGAATGGDPFLHRARLRLDGRQYPRVTVRARASNGHTIALFWTTQDSPRWGEDKVARMPLRPGADFTDYVFDLGKHAGWRDKLITGLRLDPLENDAGGSFDVDYVRGGAAGSPGAPP